MATDELLAKLIRKLQDPVPQYVLGCLPAVATIGAAPKKSFITKLFWVARCLGCPFIGLFYTCNVKIDETTIYWLKKSCFMEVYENVEEQIVAEKEIPHRPFGHHAMMVIHKNSTHSNPTVQRRLTARAASNNDVLERLNECVAGASVLERLSSLASAYYIFVGIIAGITRAIAPRACEDWPFIPLVLSWTLPAIYRRIAHGKLVVKDPKECLRDDIIYVERLATGDEEHHTRVLLTFLASTTVPWITILLAYFTPPIGYFCRSKYLTVICSVWSFNNILAYIHHWIGEKSDRFDTIISVWFNICGVFIAVALFFLALLTNENKWWVDLFGASCDILEKCPIPY
ncbi:1431_t:CDS:1 [Ambispora gerdemannii]|uniref:1431_t:CDS:1 n=1 Tax=Ambispora gerdemannii TaxID=144530 RepID=A0A9N8WLT1_9GLOM|nr:1431_t:CDS:1 [Ambispora gerdemannii]